MIIFLIALLLQTTQPACVQYDAPAVTHDATFIGDWSGYTLLATAPAWYLHEQGDGFISTFEDASAPYALPTAGRVVILGADPSTLYLCEPGATPWRALQPFVGA